MKRVVLLLMSLVLSATGMPSYSTLYEMVFGKPGCSNGCGPFTCCTPAPSCSFVQPIDFNIWEFSPFMHVVFTAATAEVYKIDNICYSFVVDDVLASAFSSSITYEDGTNNIKTFGTSKVVENVYKAEGGPCKYDFEVTAVIQEAECLRSPVYIMNRCFCNECVKVDASDEVDKYDVNFAVTNIDCTGCSDDSMVIGVSSDPHVDQFCVNKAMAVAAYQFPCFHFRSMPNLLMPACIPPANVIDLPSQI